VTFNAASNVAAGVRRATQCFFDIDDYVSATFPGWHVAAGLSSAQAMAGTIGNSHAVISSVTDQAEALRGLSTQFHHIGARCLTSNKLKDDLATCAVTQTLGFVQLPDISFTKLLAVMAPPGDDAADEWMYELEAGDKTNPYAALNRGFDQFADGDVDAAKATLAKRNDEAMKGGADQKDAAQAAILERILADHANAKAAAAAFTARQGLYFRAHSLGEVTKAADLLA